MSECVIVKFVVSSPVGRLMLECCQRGLHSINYTLSPRNFSIGSIKSVELIEPICVNKDDNIGQVVDWLQLYFLDPQNLALQKIPTICEAALQRETFRGRVRLALVENVKFGQTISYGELAEIIGNKGASRAVGSAMSNNPISIIVPCHRVIKSDGSLGNYGKGTRNEVKKWLLEYEAQASKK